MNRRRLLFAGGAFVAGFAGVKFALDRIVMAHTIPPWHLWGNSQTVKQVIGNAVGQVSRQSQQLAQCRYKRPTTWDFLLSAEITDYNDNGLQPVGRVVNILFDLQLGLGLATQIIRRFVRFDFQLGSVGGPELHLQRWTTQVAQPLTVTGSTIQTFCNEFPAESIQCSAQIIASQGGNGYEFTTVLGAQFAPRNHVRPDWFKGSFDGGELEGK